MKRRARPATTRRSAVGVIVPRDLVPSLLAWFAANARDLPWRHTLDPYVVWVSEIMLQQTQVKTVIPYFARWMRALPTVESLAKASSEKIHKLWEGLGYYTRVRNMQKAAQVIVEQQGGRFPREFDQILALPGIGRYTAGAICSIAFNQPRPILDGNVIRVLTRVFGMRENAREKETNARLWKLAEELVQAAVQTSLSPQRGEGLRVRGGSVPRSDSQMKRAGDTTPHPSPLPVEGRGSRVSPTSTYFDPPQLSGPCSALNQSLMELGALVCTPRQAKCEMCPLQSLCTARREGLVETLPNLGPRPVTTARRFAACVLERDGQFLVRQRPAGVVNAHLWEFPNVEIPPQAGMSALHAALEAGLNCSLQSLSPLLTVKHSITRYRITLDVFRAQLQNHEPAGGAGVWLKKSGLMRRSFTTAHRRVVNIL